MSRSRAPERSWVIDLSVGSVVAFVGAMAGVMISQWHIPWPLAVVLCLVIGALVGACIKGLVLLAAVAFDVYNKRRSVSR